MPDDVTLTIGGMIYGGWTSIELAMGIDAVAPSFKIGITERWPNHPERWVIDAGAPAVVAIGGETMITGYIDSLESDLVADQHNISISGRSKTADLIDCSAINTPGSWKNLKLEAIAAEIAAPFGITVTADASTGAPFKAFALQQGETAWDAIERMLKQRGLLGITDVKGNLHLVSPKPGPPAFTITQGREPIEISGSHDVSDRFSRYIAKGQAAGDDHANGAVTTGPRGEASDPGVRRYRPLIVMAEEQASTASLRTRAAWEASVRAAKAQSAVVTLPGWRQPGGLLWQPMQLAHLTAPSAWMDDALMIVSATFRLDEGGRKTELKFGRAEAYTQLPISEDARASSIIKQHDSSKVHR